jgi:NAD(P)-dependent dehydrogenase (short-subunit alcohol dehydrogenase family)
MRTVLITGTSSGIGLAATVELARAGWRVFATMRDASRRSLLEEALCAQSLAGHVEIDSLDVTDAGSTDQAVSSILARSGGGLDAVVHNAGVAVGGAFEDMAANDLRRVMEVNFFGVLELTKRLLPVLRAQRRGRIVIISSDAAFAGEPTNAIYSASKWALEGWAEGFAYEVEPFNIQTVLIEPGPYRTNIWEASPRLHPPGTAYGPLLSQLNAAVDAHVAKSARDPAEVGRVIRTALEARTPRFRYAVGPYSKLGHVMRGKVPSTLIRRGVQRFLGIHNIRL